MLTVLIAAEFIAARIACLSPELKLRVGVSIIQFIA